MAPQRLRRTFREIGARLLITDWARDRRAFFRIGIRRTHCLEQFEMAGSGVSIDITDVNVRLRQLLLLARWDEAVGREIENLYLCGFDERHWFTAAIPPTPGMSLNTVAAAHEALKPIAARVSQATHRVPARLLNERQNPGFVRQGEWFFIPRPELSFDPRQAQRNVALRRGSGNPHVVQYLVGDAASVLWDGWRSPDSDRRMYARGTVRHRDHRTVRLPFWYQVELSEEVGVSVD